MCGVIDCLLERTIFFNTQDSQESHYHTVINIAVKRVVKQGDAEGEASLIELLNSAINTLSVFVLSFILLM
jgi:hypothetical protein